MGSTASGPFLTLGLSQSEPRLDLPDQIAEWRLEAELACPSPRAVAPKWRFSGKVFWAIVILLLGALFLGWRLQGFGVAGEAPILAVLFGIALFVYLEIATRRNTSKLLVSRGVATRGVVVRKEWVDGEAGGCFECTVAYDTVSGSRLTLSTGDQELVAGDTLTILYLPESPEKAMPYHDCAYKAVLASDSNVMKSVP